MLLFLALVSLMMMIVCSLLLNYFTKNFYKNILKTYFYIFAVSAFTLSGYSLYHTKSHWYPAVSSWMKEQTEQVYALAGENETAAESSAFPLLNDSPLQKQVQLEVNVIEQYPELPRGCEVTSLAMLLQYYEIKVNKMELADKIKRDPTPYQKTEDGIYFGNPASGFVGDMYSLENPGYGVYHKPVAELARHYAGEQVKDFSGGYFFEVLKHLSEERPVWVIINTTYKKLPSSQFTTWQTPSGEISITRKEHAVVLTGYDDKYIYFSDPLKKEKKAPIESFEEAWVQMGKQAITIVQS